LNWVDISDVTTKLPNDMSASFANAFSLAGQTEYWDVWREREPITIVFEGLAIAGCIS